MSKPNLDGDEKCTSKGTVGRKCKRPDPECSVSAKQAAQFVDKHRSELIQKVCMVMPIVNELLSQGLLNAKTRLQISKANTDEEKMIELYNTLDAGGDNVKSAFYYELRDHEPHLLHDLDFDFSKEFKGDMTVQYKTSIADSCMFVTEYKLPSDERVKLTTRYTEPVIIQKSKEQTEKYCQIYMKSAHASGASTSPQLLSNDKNQSIRIDQLFSPDRDGNTPKTVILSGDSGRGKSFILQKIMLDWASGELYAKNFDIVFLLNCEELMSLSEEMTLTELLSWSCSLTSDEISEILELTPEKVLFLVDGVDEYKSQPCSYLVSPQNNPSKRAPTLVNLKNLLRGILLPQSFMLITTTFVAANALMNLHRGPQRFTEIEGFSERGVQEYFQKFFQDEQLFRKTYESVKTNETLLTYCSVPLLCWMVCFCLKKRFKDVNQVIKEINTITSIYVQFVSTLLEDHHQSQSLLRSLGQLAKKGMKKRHVLFDEKTVNKTVSDPAASVFLLKTKGKPEPVFRFMHLSFQRFFTALHFFLDKTNHWWKTADRLSSYLISSDHLLFIYGLLNKKVHSQLFNGCDWSSSDMIKLKTELQKELLKIISTMSKQCRVKLLALHCMYELQDEDLTRRALAGWVSVDLSNVSLRSTVCLVLLYCLQFCPHIRDLNLMYCDLTADKLKILQPALALCETLRVQVDEISAESPRWSLDLSSTHRDVLLSLTFSKKNPLFPTVLNISLTCALSSTGWTLLLQRLSGAGKLAKNFSYHDEHISLLLASFRSMGLKTMDLKLVSLNESWVSGIIALFQNCTSLQQLSVSICGLQLEEGRKLLKNSLTDPDCTVIIEGHNNRNKKGKIHFKRKVLDKLEKLNCQSCVHIADSDQWLQVEPSVYKDKRGSEFRISTQAGRFQCSRTRIRWVCDMDVTLQYRPVDGQFLNTDLEKLQCERIAPVFDVNVISGKLEEAHLPHYICLAESDPAPTDSVKLLSKRDDGISLQSVELSRYHAKIVQPSFSLTTLIINWFIKREEHCNLLIYMRLKNPLILHIYFFPVNDTWSKEKVEQREKSSFLISHPRPNRPFRMKTPHLLKVPGASVHPVEGISFRADVEPNFFKLRKKIQDDDVQMNLIREEDKKSVWTATLWKDELVQLNLSEVQGDPQLNSENQFFNTHRVALIDRVRNVMTIADKLHAQGVIQREQYSDILQNNLTSQDNMRKICDLVDSGGVAAQNKFIEILREEEPCLFEELRRSGS